MVRSPLTKVVSCACDVWVASLNALSPEVAGEPLEPSDLVADSQAELASMLTMEPSMTKTRIQYVLCAAGGEVIGGTGI